MSRRLELRPAMPHGQTCGCQARESFRGGRLAHITVTVLSISRYFRHPLVGAKIPFSNMVTIRSAGVSDRLARTGHVTNRERSTIRAACSRPARQPAHRARSRTVPAPHSLVRWRRSHAARSVNRRQGSCAARFLHAAPRRQACPANGPDDPAAPVTGCRARRISRVLPVCVPVGNQTRTYRW